MNERAGSDRGLLGHPGGLWVLVFTETWERLSHYGMRAILVLYMIAPATLGGLGLSKAVAGNIYGWYGLGLYACALPGGWAADRFLGRRKAILIGGVVITLGHLLIAFHGFSSMVAGLACISAGTGLLKPNVSTTVGRLYRRDDPRRDSAYSIEYWGVNLGAFFAPLVCGYMAENAGFLRLLARFGVVSSSGWAWAFGFAGLGMIVGLTQFILFSRRIEEVADSATVSPDRTELVHPPLTHQDWARMGVIAILFLFSSVFWALFMQAGSSFSIFAKDYTRETIGGFAIPASWYQSINAGFILIFAPIFAWLWTKLGDRFSSPSKFASGLFFLGLGMLLMVPAARIAQGTPGMIVRVSPFWLIGLYFMHTLAELCFSPVGMSLTSRLAPPRFAGLMMGVWFASIGAGFYVSGAVTGLMDRLPLTLFFGVAGWIALGAGLLLWFLKPVILRLMGGD
jgi:proton-dependent oligopeptide transporter, POT family